MPKPNTTRPVLLAKFGGVTINENDVQNKKVINTNGTTRYIINFNDGTTVEYPEQNERNNSTIFWEHVDKSTRSEQPVYTNMAYAKITGSKNMDLFNLYGCNSCFIDVSNDTHGDLVILRDSANRNTQNNKVKMDKYDATYLKNYEAARGTGTMDESAYY